MKIPKARKLPSGKWNIELQLDGKRRSVTAATKKECEKKAELIKAEHRNGIERPAPKSITLRKAIDKYISSRTNVLSPATIKGYKSIQDNRFQAVMDSRICDINDWQSLVNLEAETISAKTLENAWGLILTVLKKNNADPGKMSLPQVIQEEQLFLDPDQIKVFVDAIHGDYYEKAYLLALHSLRRSEIFALKRKNITENTILVHGATVQGEGGRFVDKPTNKNTTSRREIPILIPRILELLPDDPEKRVVSRSPDNILSHLQTICKKNGLPEIRLHDLRHSFASLCYHLNLSEKMTMQLGGWSDPTVMHRIYTHLAQKDKEAATTALQNFFKNPNENPNENSECP